MAFNIENIKTWIDEKDFDIQYGETIDGSGCFVANWSKYPRLENCFETMDRYGYNIVLLWSDNYMQCSECYKYMYTNEGLLVGDCAYYCPECCEEFVDDVIEFYKNDFTMAIPKWLEHDIKKVGFRCFDDCEKFQNGLYYGMNGNPSTIIEDLDNENLLDNYDWLFVITDSNPFMVEFTLMIRECGF